MRRMRSAVSTTGYSLAAMLALAVFVAHTARGGHGTDDDVLTVTVEQVKAFIDSHEKIILVDLRPTGDFQKARLPGARSVPIKELPKRYTEIPRSGRVVLYCDCPQNQIIDDAYLLLKDYGYRNTAVMSDGFQAWARYKYPVESGRGK
jgi:rhodanese-related sulfurtransferase